MGIWQKLFVPDEVPGKQNIGHPFDEKSDAVGFPKKSHEESDGEAEPSGKKNGREPRDGNPRIYGPARPVKGDDNPVLVVYGPADWMTKRTPRVPDDDITCLYGPAPGVANWESEKMGQSDKETPSNKNVTNNNVSEEATPPLPRR